MRTHASLFAAALLALALAACKPATPVLDKEAEPIARQFFEEVRTGADIAADTHVAHELKNPTSEDQIAEFRVMIPDGSPTQIELKDWNVVDNSTGTTTRLTEAYHYGDQVLIAQTALFKSPGGTDPVIVGFKLSQGSGS